MKKFLLLTFGFLTIITPLFFLTSSEQTFALNATEIVNYGGTDTTVPLPKIDQKEDSPEGKINHILYRAIQILLSIAGFVAVVIIVVGGVTYTISANHDDMTGRAKNMILYAVAGLLVIIFSYAIFTNLIDFLEAGERLE